MHELVDRATLYCTATTDCTAAAYAIPANSHYACLKARGVCSWGASSTFSRTGRARARVRSRADLLLPPSLSRAGCNQNYVASGLTCVRVTSSSTTSPAASATPVGPKAPNPTPVLKRTYQGAGFFDLFNFWDQPDPTHGSVNYRNREDAQALGLTSVSSTGTAIISIDRRSRLALNQPRNSVRIESKEVYQPGSLVILDLKRAPTGPSTWPAFWMVRPPLPPLPPPPLLVSDSAHARCALAVQLPLARVGRDRRLRGRQLAPVQPVHAPCARSPSSSSSRRSTDVPRHLADSSPGCTRSSNVPMTGVTNGVDPNCNAGNGGLGPSSSPSSSARRRFDPPELTRPLSLARRLHRLRLRHDGVRHWLQRRRRRRLCRALRRDRVRPLRSLPPALASSLLADARALLPRSQHLDLALDEGERAGRRAERRAEVEELGHARRRFRRLDVRHEDLLPQPEAHLCASCALSLSLSASSLCVEADPPCPARLAGHHVRLRLSLSSRSLSSEP